MYRLQLLKNTAQQQSSAICAGVVNLMLGTESGSMISCQIY